jgi:ABC-type xylose transport system permease subunit
VGLAIHWLLMASFQGKTERLSAVFERSPWKSVLLGLVNLFVIVVIVGVFSEHVPPLGVLVLAAAVVVLFIGLHARSRALGRRILKASGHEATPLAETTVGWTTVTFASAFPLAGWLAFIYFTAGGLGALTLSLFGKPAAETEKKEESVEPEKQ